MKRFNVLVLALSVIVVLSLSVYALQLASRTSEEWIQALENPQRVQGQKVDQVISRLSLKPGQVIADIGAGSGLFSLPLAKAVSPNGKVYAVDIDKGLLGYINQTSKQQNIGNIQTVLGEFGALI